MEDGQKSIVLVEDQEILAHLIEEKLTRAGYRLTTAPDGRKGLALIREKRPDLVLLDMGLPHVDGFGVLEALHKDGILPDLPVIIISNTGQNIEIDRAKKLGARDYLIKVNFNPDELVQMVNEWFAGKPPEAQEGAKGCVLIVDDEAFFVELLEQKFKAAGYAVRRAGDAAEARAVLGGEKVDAILLDVLLPGTDGLSFLQEIRNAEGEKKAPVIMLSNLSAKEGIDRALAAGADAYLVKAHVDPNDVVAKVEALIAVK